MTTTEPAMTAMGDPAAALGRQPTRCRQQLAVCVSRANSSPEWAVRADIGRRNHGAGRTASVAKQSDLVGSIAGD
jgi:hypothetical protein